jgi:hypothetical protein
MKLQRYAVVLVLLALVARPGPAAAAWTRATIEPVLGYETDIAVDGEGAVHVVFTDLDLPALKYATNASGSWHVTILDPAGSRGSIAVDPLDAVHVVYQRDGLPERGLWHATNASGSWAASRVDPSGDTGDVAVDAEGNVHAVYHYVDATGAGLRHAVRSEGGWSTANVAEADATTGDVGAHNAVAVDGAGHVHVSYLAERPFDLMYATNASGAWVTEVVDAGGYQGMWNSIAVDAGGAAHVGYYDNNDGTLAYATNASGAWVVTKRVAGVIYGPTSIAVDAAGDVHIAYYLYDHPSYGLRHLSGRPGSFVREYVDDDGLDCALALDPNGAVHISYHHAENEVYEVRHATNAVAATPEIVLEPHDADFGRVDVGEAGPSATITASNAGTADLVIGAVRIDGGEAASFTIVSDGCTGTTLPPSGACAVTVSFLPRSRGFKEVFLSVPSNDPRAPLMQAGLRGSGAQLAVLSPNGGEVIPAGTLVDVRWDRPTRAAEFRIWLSAGPGQGWKLLGRTGGWSLSWKAAAPPRNRASCSIKVAAYDAEGRRMGTDLTDAPFAVEVVRLTSPAGGETLEPGTVHEITWTTHATKRPVARTDLLYSTDGGRSWRSIIRGLPLNSGRHAWTVPSLPSPSAACLVKVVLRDREGKVVGTDASDAVFSIAP